MEMAEPNLKLTKYFWTTIIIVGVLTGVFSSLVVYAFIAEHDYRYPNIMNLTDGDIIVHDIFAINDVNVTRDLTVNGSIIGGVGGIRFRGTPEHELFSLYPFHAGMGGDVPEDFDDALILQTDDISNPYNMEFCWWDKEGQIMTFCSNEGEANRATTFRRSFQIIGNVTEKENDLNFTLCEGANYIDCSTDTTGADLLVQDDIEAQSIYANEDIEVVGNLNVGGVVSGTLSLGSTNTSIVGGNITYETFYMGVEGGIIGFTDINYINGGSVGDIVNIFITDPLKKVRLKDGTGNLDLGGLDCNLQEGDKAELRKSNGGWMLIVCIT